MNRLTLYSRKRFCCLAIAGLISVLPFFGSPEEPPAALQRFVKLFTSQDAAGMAKIIHSEITTEIEVTTEDMERFFKRYQSNSLSLESARVDERFKSEDGTTERFQATLSFPRACAFSRVPCPLEAEHDPTLGNARWKMVA